MVKLKKKKSIAFVVTPLALAALPIAGNAASFDCRKATIPVEELICTNPTLSAADTRMALAYRNALAENPEVREHQRSWLRDSRNHCQTVACLITAYSARTRALNELIQTSQPTTDDTFVETDSRSFDWTQYSFQHDIFDETRHTSMTESTNLRETMLGFYCSRQSVGDRSFFGSLIIKPPKENTLSLVEPTIAYIRVDHEPLREIELTHVGGDLFGTNILISGDFTDSSHTPLYVSKKMRSLFNEMLNGTRVHVRIDDGRSVYTPTFSLMGMTSASLPVMRQCGISSRDHAITANTISEAMSSNTAEWSE